jgi:hypothetical protein
MAQPLDTTPFNKMRQADATAVESALVTTRTTLPSTAAAVSGYRGGRFSVYSNGANNETATFTIYAVDPIGMGGYRCESLGTLAVTLGNSTMVVGAPLDASYRWADTLAWTPNTYGTALLTYVGGNAATPAATADTIAEFLWSDFGSVSHIAFVVTTYGLTATSKINVMGKLDR